MKALRKALCAVALAHAGVSSCGATAGEWPVAKEATKPPIIDGSLDDACWREATPIEGFTVADSPLSPRKPIKAKVCYDDSAMYFGIVCGEPEPDRIKAEAASGGSDVWRDDCVEIFLRNSSRPGEFFQFVVNSRGVGQALRRTSGQSASDWRPAWTAGGKTGRTQWVAEAAIPYSAIDTKTPSRGDSIGLKIGREDRVGEQPELATWPGDEQYGRLGGFGILFFGSNNLVQNAESPQRPKTIFAAVNLIKNPDLSQGLQTNWDVSELAKRTFSARKSAGENVIYVETPGGYATLAQTLELAPNSRYLFSVKAKGTSLVDFRLRGTAAGGMQRVQTKPADDYREYSLIFRTLDDPNPSLSWGTLNSSPPGEVYLKDLKVLQLIAAATGDAACGPAIEVKPGAACTVEKVLVKASRVLRGMDLAPVDGSVQTRSWNGDVYEYGAGGGDSYGGVKYAYKDNNGLHISLADRKGVDAIVIQKGAACDLYADCPQYDRPDDGRLLAQFPGNADKTRAVFADRVISGKFSFFNVTEGFLGNVSFFRISRDKPAGTVTTWSVTNGKVPLYKIGPAVASAAIDAAKGKELHLQSGPLPSEFCLDAVGLAFTLSAESQDVPLTLAIQDPVNSRRELLGADFQLHGGGEYRIYLDIYDQVIPPSKKLWFKLKSGCDATFANPQVELFPMRRSEALPEALAYNKMMLLAQFIPLSEPRPWMAMKATTKDSVAWARERGGDQLAELFETLAYCRSLDAQDDTVRQMHEWLHQVPLQVFSHLPEPRIEPTPGAPEWADVLHQTWLALRGIPQWWIENRLVPTGEFGGQINDDTCMYQNWVDFPMYEEGEVGRELKAGMRNLAALILQTKFGKDTGIPARTTDPLHYCEDGISHMASMVWLDYGDPAFVEQVLHAARSIEEGLTTVVRGDKRHFKSQEMGGEDLRIQRKLGVAGQYHFLAVHPSLMAVWYNDNPRAKKMLRQWADSWLGYYDTPGTYARMIDVATGKVVDTYSYLRGPQGSAQIMLASLLGDEKYAKPLQELSELSTREQWTRSAMTKCVTSNLVEVNDRVRAAAERCGGFPDFVVNGNKQSLIRDLKQALAEVSRFDRYYTTFEPFTDRLFMQHLTSQLGAAYLGGYCTRNYYANTHAVSWKGFGTDYAALCLRSRLDGLKFLVYSYADAPMTGQMTVWALEHGRYTAAQGLDANGDDEADAAVKEETLELYRGVPVNITLAPRQVTVIEIKQLAKLPDVRGRADLALSPMQVWREGNAVTGIVHNIGAELADVVVALVDDKGSVAESRSLGPLAAPLDLHPKKTSFRFDKVPARAAGWMIVADPDNRVSEVYEGNNRVEVPSPGAR